MKSTLIVSVFLFLCLPTVAKAEGEKYFYMEYVSILNDTVAITDICYGNKAFRLSLKKEFREDCKKIMVPKTFYHYKNKSDDKVYRRRKNSIRSWSKTNKEVRYLDYCDE